MSALELDMSRLRDHPDVAGLIADIAASKADILSRSAAALALVCRGIITGEGPTVSGRMHFSRTIDVEDTTLCECILVEAGRSGDPVSRQEADVLFDIHAVAGDRRDGGRFDDLLAKAVVHHVMSACALIVPGRVQALDPATPLQAWARRPQTDEETGSWLEARLREMSRNSRAAHTIAWAVSGAEVASQTTLAAVFDLAA